MCIPCIVQALKGVTIMLPFELDEVTDTSNLINLYVTVVAVMYYTDWLYQTRVGECVHVFSV